MTVLGSSELLDLLEGAESLITQSLTDSEFEASARGFVSEVSEKCLSEDHLAVRVAKACASKEQEGLGSLLIEVRNALEELYSALELPEPTEKHKEEMRIYYKWTRLSSKLNTVYSQAPKQVRNEDIKKSIFKNKKAKGLYRFAIYSKQNDR